MIARHADIAADAFTNFVFAPLVDLVGQKGIRNGRSCRADEIEYAAPMHDIGKIGIQDNILLKPGKFEQTEWMTMQQHTIIGHSILSNSQSRYIQTGSIIALNHHERFDGSGYPNGTSGKDIPLVARIVSVADVYDALVSARPYKRPWQAKDAQDYLHKHAGTQFDPICVEAFH